MDSTTTVRQFLIARLTWLHAGLIVALVLAAAAAYLGGRAHGTLAQQDEDRAQAALEQQLIALVVERNPQATIRDFADFPRALLEVSRAARLDFRIVLAVVDKESGFRPDAVGKDGEIGLMQLLPSTAEMVAKRLGVDFEPPVAGRNGAYLSLGSLADPRLNIRLGTTYLRWQIDRYGFNATALRAYNRHPDRAREHRPWDRYAEEVSLRFLALVHALR